MHVYIHKIDLDTDENGPSTIWLKPLYNHPRRTLGKKNINAVNNMLMTMSAYRPMSMGKKMNENI